MKTQSVLPICKPKLSTMTSDNVELSSKYKPLQQPMPQDAASDTKLSQIEQVAETLQQLDGEFILFPKLPPEIRNKIYRHSMPGPRIIRIEHDPSDMYTVSVTQADLEEGRNPWWRAKAIVGPVPALVHVSQEARSFMRHYYKLFFAKQTLGRPIYFNAAQDTLFLDSEVSIRAFYGQKMHGYTAKLENELKHMYDTENQVRLLALSSNLLWEGGFTHILLRYTNLDEVTQFEVTPDYRHRHGLVHKWFQQYWAQAGSKVPQFKYLSEDTFAQKYTRNGN